MNAQRQVQIKVPEQFLIEYDKAIIERDRLREKVKQQDELIATRTEVNSLLKEQRADDAQKLKIAEQKVSNLEAAMLKETTRANSAEKSLDQANRRAGAAQKLGLAGAVVAFILGLVLGGKK